MTKKISITGTESTGKTELAEKLATHYQTVLAPDYSRIYIEQLNRPYTEQDVLEIARTIIEEEKKIAASDGSLFFSDNDLINIKIWLQYYQWKAPLWLEEAIRTYPADLYLLCDIDLPWVADEQRANPHDRKALLEQFVAELNVRQLPYRLVTGHGAERFHNAVIELDKWMERW